MPAAIRQQPVSMKRSSAYEEARRILEENKEKLHELAKFLYERETITGEQFMEIVNRVPQLETAQNL